MKSNNHPSLYFSLNPLKALKKETNEEPARQSPYLRAVLSTKRSSGPGRVVQMGNSTMAAALRYINNHKLH